MGVNARLRLWREAQSQTGSVLSELPEDVAGYGGSKGTLQFAVDSSLPKPLVEKLIAVRLSQLPQR